METDALIASLTREAGPVRRMMASVATSPTQQLRIAGVVSAVMGLAVVWLIRG